MPDRTTVFPVTDGHEAEDPERRLKRGWRAQADTSGRCPVCGATLRAPNRAECRGLTRRYGAGVGHVVMDHDARCPVGDGPLRAAS